MTQEQTYFAVQTRRQELDGKHIEDDLAEDEQRLDLRNKIRQHNSQLVNAAKDAGVVQVVDCHFSESWL